MWLNVLTDRQVDLQDSVEGDEDEEVEILEDLELEERMGRVEADVELDGDVRVQLDVVGVNVVLKFVTKNCSDQNWTMKEEQSRLWEQFSWYNGAPTAVDGSIMASLVTDAVFFTSQNSFYRWHWEVFHLR